MRPFSKSAFVLMAACLVALAGCKQQKLNYEKTFTLIPAEAYQAFPVDAPKSEQQVSVAVTSTGSPINVYVVLESDHDALKEALTQSKKPDASKILASKEKMETGTLEVTVPAQKGFSVFVSGATKKADVNLKITGK